jgi:uncharacterized RDD family membrane protein YckC
MHNPGTLAQAAVAATAPEGMLIAPLWKRIVAIGLDIFLLTLIVSLLTQNKFYGVMMKLDLLVTKDVLWIILHWVIHIVLYWLYFKYTGRSYGRSLGQRAMRIAIVHDDGTLLGEAHWGKRGFHKTRYVIPILGQLIGLIDIFRTWRHETKRSPIDLRNHTVAAVDWSLPITTRGGLK